MKKTIRQFLVDLIGDVANNPAQSIVSRESRSKLSGWIRANARMFFVNENGQVSVLENGRWVESSADNIRDFDALCQFDNNEILLPPKGATFVTSFLLPSRAINPKLPWTLKDKVELYKPGFFCIPEKAAYYVYESQCKPREGGR